MIYSRIIRYIHYIMVLLFITFVFMGYDLLFLLVGCAVIYPILFIYYLVSSKAYKSWSWRKAQKRKNTPYRVLISSKKQTETNEEKLDFLHFDDEESEDAYQTVDYDDDDEDEEFDDVVPDEELEDPSEDSITSVSNASTVNSDNFDKQYRLSKVEKVLEKVDRVPRMGGIEFEEFLRDLYDALGYEVHKTNINDQGADLIVLHQGEKIVIQAKRYKSSVSNSAVQQVYTAKAFYDCDKAIVITNSSFTKSAREVAEKVGVELWDHEALKSMLNSMKSMLIYK